MRQRAAWSLSNVISAMCEHDDKDGVAPAVALQGLAVATCATVRKCLNDNDKVCRFFCIFDICVCSCTFGLHHCICMYAFMFTSLPWHRFDLLESAVLECLGN